MTVILFLKLFPKLCEFVYSMEFLLPNQKPKKNHQNLDKEYYAIELDRDPYYEKSKLDHGVFWRNSCALGIPHLTLK